MTHPRPSSLSQRTLVIGTVIGCAITAVLLLINFLLLWLPEEDLPEGVSIFYWQQFGKYLTWLQCMICVLTPLAVTLLAYIGIWRLRMWQSIIAVGVTLLLLFACAFSYYLAFFIRGAVSHVGTVELQGNFYHLARVDKYDNESVYHLGKCNPQSYWCAFHPIYRVNLFRSSEPEISLSNDKLQLIVKVNGDSVYTFDGVQKHCADSEHGFCVENSH